MCLGRGASDILSDTLRTFAARAEKKRRSKKRVRFAPNVILQQVVSDGNLEELMDLREKHGSDILNSSDTHGTPLIVRAVVEDQFKILKYFVSQGANLQLADEEGWTALHHAADVNDLKMVALLLNEDTRLTNIKNFEGLRPIDLALTPEMISILMYANLLSFNMELKELQVSQKPTDSSPRSMSCQFTSCDSEEECEIIVTIASHKGRKLILDQIKRIEEQEGVNLLHLAAEKSFVRLAWLLLQNKLKGVNEKDSTNSTPLHVAASQMNVEVIVLLKDFEASLKAVNAKGFLPEQCTNDTFTLNVLRFSEQ